MERDGINDGRVGGDYRSRARETAAISSYDYFATSFLYSVDGGTSAKQASLCLDGAGQPCKVLERVKGCLARIAQGMLLLATRQRLDANDTVNRRAHLADRVQFLIDDGGVCVQCLEQEAIQPAKIARDFFLLLCLFDPVDCRGLTDIKGRGDVLTAQLDHCRG